MAEYLKAYVCPCNLLTTGEILLVEGKQGKSKIGRDRFFSYLLDGILVYAWGQDWNVERAGVLLRAEQRRQQKLDELRHQIECLENLKFQFVTVSTNNPPPESNNQPESQEEPVP